MLIKVAVDTAAKNYWKLLFGDYGEQLTKDVPRRVKAALAKKVANLSEECVVLPTAHVDIDGGVKVEGMYRDANNKLMFLATINNTGEVTDIKSFDIK
jgi:hypothetical protein